jgi:hypothetical protein
MTNEERALQSDAHPDEVDVDYNPDNNEDAGETVEIDEAEVSELDALLADVDPEDVEEGDGE